MKLNPPKQRPRPRQPASRKARPPSARTRKPVIGLVGGIGAGKSTIARLFERLGCGVIDADVLAGQALQRPAVKRRLKAWWGPAVLTAAGNVDRRRLADITFGHPSQLKRLEGLIHPLVHQARRRLRRRYDRNTRIKAIIEDVPLLLEKGLVGQCDAVVYVRAKRAVRLRRLARSRGWSRHELQRREKAQAPLDKKRRNADYVIDNNADMGDSLSQTRRVLSQILKRFQSAARPRRGA